jgi:hypothetical protein
MKTAFVIVAAVLLEILVATRLADGNPRQANAPQGTAAHRERSLEVAAPLFGAWKNQEDNESVVRFEAKKCTFARIGKPGLQIVRATYEPGKIVTHSWGRMAEFRFELKDCVLILTPPSGTATKYFKLDRIPSELDVKPLILGAVNTLRPKSIQSVQNDLAKRAKLDQEVRTDGAKLQAMAKVDSDNTAWLVKLVQEVGWIDAARFGAPTANHAFLIVQHSMNVPLMLAALPFIEKDMKAKRLDAQPYALLFDRLQVMLSEKQRYGTQISTDETGRLVLLPLEDRARVEELRKTIGLFPLAEYLRLFEKQNGGKAVTLQDDGR